MVIKEKVKTKMEIAVIEIKTRMAKKKEEVEAKIIIRRTTMEVKIRRITETTIRRTTAVVNNIEAISNRRTLLRQSTTIPIHQKIILLIIKNLVHITSHQLTPRLQIRILLLRTPIRQRLTHPLIRTLHRLIPTSPPRQHTLLRILRLIITSHAVAILLLNQYLLIKNPTLHISVALRTILHPRIHTAQGHRIPGDIREGRHTRALIRSLKQRRHPWIRKIQAQKRTKMKQIRIGREFKEWLKAVTAAGPTSVCKTRTSRSLRKMATLSVMSSPLLW